MQEKSGRPVGHPFGVHAVEEAEIIDVPGDFWKEAGNVLSAISVVPEGPQVLHDFHGLG